MLGKNNKIYVWRKSTERLRPECVGVRGDLEANCRASMMFWGCITYYGVGTLTPVQGNMNSEQYISVLDDFCGLLLLGTSQIVDGLFKKTMHLAMSRCGQINGSRKMI